MGSGNPVEVVDNALGTNFSGNGPGNSVLNQIGSQINRSDPGKFIGRAGTDLGNLVKTPFIAASDLARGDTQQAGRTIGRGIGSTGNIVSMGTNYLAQDNKQTFKKIGGYDPSGMVSDYADFTSAQDSLVQQKNLTSDEIWGSARLGVKALTIGEVAAHSGQIGSWWSGTGAKDAALVGSALKPGAKPGDVLNAVSPGLGDTFNSYLPEQPSWLPDLTELFKPIGGEAPQTFNQSGASDPGPGPMISAGGGASMALVALAIGGALIMKARRK